jgi:hypothetical protein
MITQKAPNVNTKSRMQLRFYSFLIIVNFAGTSGKISRNYLEKLTDNQGDVCAVCSGKTLFS